MKEKNTSKLIAIKCPNCGSIRCEAAGDDLFKCLNCRSTFLVDREQQNTYNTYNYNNGNNNGNIQPLGRRTVGLIVTASIFLLMVIVGLLSRSSKSGIPFIREKPPSVNITDKEQGMYPVTANNRIQLWRLLKRTSSATHYPIDSIQYLIQITDPMSQRLIDSIVLTPRSSAATSTSITAGIGYADGHCWINEANRQVRGFNIHTRLETVNNDSLEKKYAQYLQTGIIAVKMENPGSPLFYYELNTSNGVQCRYYPGLQKVLTREESALIPALHPAKKKGAHLLTTGKYFHEQVLYSDSSRVIIGYQGDANERSPYIISSIHPQTAAIQWTVSDRRLDPLRGNGAAIQVTIDPAARPKYLLLLLYDKMAAGLDLASGSIQWVYRSPL